MKSKTHENQFIDTDSNVALMKMFTVPNKEQLDGLKHSTYIFIEDTAFYFYNIEDKAEVNASFKKIELSPDALDTLKGFLQDKAFDQSHLLGMETLKAIHDITQHTGTTPEAYMPKTALKKVKSNKKAQRYDKFTPLENKTTPIVDNPPIEKSFSESARDFSTQFSDVMQEAKRKIGAGVKQMSLKPKSMDEQLINAIIDKEKEYASLLHMLKMAIHDASIKGSVAEKNSNMHEASRLAKIEKATTEQLITLLKRASSYSGGSLEQIAHQVSSHLSASYVEMKNKVTDVVSSDVLRLFTPEKEIDLLAQLQAMKLAPQTDLDQLTRDLISTFDKAMSDIHRIGPVEKPMMDDDVSILPMGAHVNTNNTIQKTETVPSLSSATKKDYLSLLKKELEAQKKEWAQYALKQAQNYKESEEQELKEAKRTLEVEQKIQEAAKKELEKLQREEDEVRALEAVQQELEQAQREQEKATQALEEAKRTLEAELRIQEEAKQTLEVVQREEEEVQKLEETNQELEAQKELEAAKQELQTIQQELKAVQQQLKTVQDESKEVQRQKEVMRQRGQQVNSFKSVLNQLELTGNLPDVITVMIETLKTSADEYINDHQIAPEVFIQKVGDAIAAPALSEMPY